MGNVPIRPADQPSGDELEQAEQSEVRVAIQRFLIMGLMALVIVATPVTLWVRALTLEHSLQSAEERTERMAQHAIAPFVTDELLAGDPEAIELLETVTAPRIKDESVDRIKVWDEEGRIVYSDVPELIGQQFELPEDARHLFEGGEAHATLEQQDESENRFETGKGELVEVYVKADAAAGMPLVFEAYFPDDDVRAEQNGLVLGMVPAFLVSLAVLQLAQLIPAVAMAKRLQAYHQDRRRLLQQAIAASDLERRRIARDLHDEVIQDISGLSYALEAEEMRSTEAQRPLLAQARSILQHNVTVLRGMTTELYPPDLAELGLPTALARLGDLLMTQGITVEYELPKEIDLDKSQAAMYYRVAREVLMNVSKHAQATHVKLSLLPEPDKVVLQIADNGRGFDVSDGSPEGHLGLQLIRDTVAEAGGSLDIRSVPGEGTCVTTSLAR